MKRQRIMLFALIAVLALAGCKEEGKATGGETANPVEGQGMNIGTEGAEAGTSMPTATPTPAMTPEQKELCAHLRDMHKDEVSARIVEKGYYYEVNQTVEDENFRVDFKAVTGDMKNPQLVFDITVKDESLAAAYDEMKVFAYTLGEDAFDNNLDSFGHSEGYGKKDETVGNLYHVTMRGAPAWMTYGESFVVDVCGVNFEKTREYDIDIEYAIDTPEYRITVPQYEYHPVLEMGYVDFVYTYKGMEFLLERAEYGQYTTAIRFVTYVEESTMKEYPGGAEQYTEAFWPEWKAFLSTMTLEVDGVEYEVRNNVGMGFHETSSVKGDYEGAGYVESSGVDFGRASEVILWVGSNGYNLKSGNNVVLTREQPVPTRAPEMPQEQKDLAEQVKTLYKDEASASLIERGYYRMVNESFADGIFRFEFKAVTGDKDHRIMLFDVYVEDAVLAETYDKICLHVGCNREENYDPEDTWAWNCWGYGYRDEEVSNLYHVAVDGALFGYVPVMVDIYEIGFDVDTNTENGIQWYNVNPEGRLVTVPEEVFAPILTVNYEEKTIVFTHEGKQYELRYAAFGAYATDLAFYTDIDASEVPTDDTELWNYREDIQKDWLSFSASLRLVADGVEYPVIDEDGMRGYVWFDVEEGRESYRGNAHPYFPTVEYGEAKEIRIKAGDTTYRLK